MSLKKFLFAVCFITMFSVCFAQEEKSQKYPQMDGDLKFYLSSLLGNVTGNNAVFAQEDYESIDSCFNFMSETRFSVVSFWKTTISVSFGFNAYSESAKDASTFIGMSFGAGAFFHLFDFPTFPLNGLCVYLYPVYQIPIYNITYEPYLKWKMAFDLGYNLTVLETVTIYPYMRNIIGWNSNDFRYGLDFGIAVGIYFHDRNYY